jgi:2',3'-cyclic-nucleotide 2'-phosphodiesterase (5'-nucleotidase family)
MRNLSSILSVFLLATLHAGAAGKIVISQVYGGGGNSGATYKNDFIELHNVGDASVNVTGWSVQYGAASGTSWQVTPLSSAAIPPGGYFLVQEAAGSGGTDNLPTPDTTGSIAMSATVGKVLVASTTTAQSGTTPGGAQVLDLVGYGSTANGYEGSGPAPAPSNTTAVQRLNQGTTDTDNNAGDFVAGAPAPRNSASAPYPVGPSQVRVETLADGSGVVVPAQSLASGTALTVYAIVRDALGLFVTNDAAVWSLINKTGGVVDGDLVPAPGNKSATFTGSAAGNASIRATSGSLASVDSGLLTVVTAPTPPSGNGLATPAGVALGSNVLLTVQVTPGLNPASTGLTVTGDLSAIGGSAGQVFLDDGSLGDAVAGDLTFSYLASVPDGSDTGEQTLPITVADDQARTTATSITVRVLGGLTLFHINDMHSRLNPHKLDIAGTNDVPVFEEVGGAAWFAAKLQELKAANPESLVIDAGDLYDGSPVGDWDGERGMFEFLCLLDMELKALGGRGLDCVLIGNHDVRTMAGAERLKTNGFFPVLSINVCSNGTQNSYFQPYNIVETAGHRVGIIGFTHDTSSYLDPALVGILEVVPCVWSDSNPATIDLRDTVQHLRSNQNCDIVILAAHIGHSRIVSTADALLRDDGVVKPPEVAITGHWHTYDDTVWQPSTLNHKTLLAEAGSYMQYVGELRLTPVGRYGSATKHIIRTADITPDTNFLALVEALELEVDSQVPAPPYQLHDVVGYSAVDLRLDKDKWWTPNEFPWSGDNTAGEWIADGMVWKAAQLGHPVQLAMQSGGGVRRDIPAGPVTYREIYETYPWQDDNMVKVQMTGQQIWDFIEADYLGTSISKDWFVRGFDGKITELRYSNAPVNLAANYEVMVSEYMYTHDNDLQTVPGSMATNLLSSIRGAVVDYTAQFTSTNPLTVPGPRYELNTEHSGGFKAVVTMVHDMDTQPYFEAAFVRLLEATPDTVARRGTYVSADLVNADGSINPTNRFREVMLYRSHLGFPDGVLTNGMILEVRGEFGFFAGNPQLVEQEGIVADGQEFTILGSDASLALPEFMPHTAAFFNNDHENHFVQFYAVKASSTSVRDSQGSTITVYQPGGFYTTTVPGVVGDLVLLRGVATERDGGYRFRLASAAVVSNHGFPPSSHVQAAPYLQNAPNLSLTAIVEDPESASSGTAFVPPVADAQVVRLRPTSNYGGSASLYVQSALAGSYGDERGWLKFDLGSAGVPSSATLLTAALEAYCWRSSAAGSLEAEVLGGDDSWTEFGITWDTQPSIGMPLDTNIFLQNVEDLYYSWDVLSFVEAERGGDGVASFVIKPVEEGNATEIGFGFDAKEYGSLGPRLAIQWTNATLGTTVTQLVFEARYSVDGSHWTAWSAFTTNAVAPWVTGFNYPQGLGFYEFRSLATDEDGNKEPVPTSADAVVRFAAPDPIPLEFSVRPEGLVLNWSNPAYSLAWGTNVLQVTNRISGATQSHTNSMSGPEGYFRLVWP